MRHRLQLEVTVSNNCRASIWNACIAASISRAHMITATATAVPSASSSSSRFFMRHQGILSRSTSMLDRIVAVIVAEASLTNTLHLKYRRDTNGRGSVFLGRGQTQQTPEAPCKVKPGKVSGGDQMPQALAPMFAFAGRLRTCRIGGGAMPKP